MSGNNNTDSNNPVVQRLLLELAELKSQFDALQKSATTDPLTKAMNRGELERRICAELERARRSGKPVSIVFFDLDNFGQFNNKFGHQVGDQVLIRSVNMIKSMLRPYDEIGRYGGEEFVIVLPGTNSFEAHDIAQRICAEMVDTPYIFGNHREIITVSMGVASSEDLSGKTNQEINKRLELIIKQANEAERAAKADGKARAYVNICGAILDPQEAKDLRHNESMLAIIERHRNGTLLDIRGVDGQSVAISHFIKSVRMVSKPTGGVVPDLADFKIKLAGDSTTVWTAYLRSPEENMSAVRDTTLQLLGQLRANSLNRFPNPSQGLWQNVPDINALTLLITHKCPMNCIYCSQDHRSPTTLSAELWKKAMNEVTMDGARKDVLLNITGGEPFMERNLLFDLLEHGRNLGMYVIMNTNAMPLTIANARDLVGTGIRSISISLDSSLPETEDEITRTPGAFGKVMNGLIALAKAREDSLEQNRVVLGYVITKKNFQGFVDFVQTLCDIRRDAGLKLFDDINPLPVKDAPHLYLSMEEIRLFNDNIVPQVRYLAEKYDLPLLRAKVEGIFGGGIPRGKKEEYEPRIWLASQGIYYGFEDMMTTPCLLALVSASILPDGSVFPCTYHRESDSKDGRLLLGNLKDETLKEMRKRYFETLRLLPRTAEKGVNPVCERLCGPDLKALNKGVLAGLRKANAL
jgi:diguanylate cyclase (GGDEF)-like protein